MATKKKLPGELTATETSKGWQWRWKSPRGDVSFGSTRHSTKAAALSAGRGVIGKKLPGGSDE